jgi:tetratricopeptide (TPR) repeat protein
LNYQLIGRSDTQIREQYEADPNELSIEEILYSSMLTEDIKKIEEIFNTAIKLYPTDHRAYNNLGVLAYNRGDYNTAASYFAKASNADNTAPEIKINLGYLDLMQGNTAAAESNITTGAKAKAGDEALGNLYIAQGLYGRATSQFGDSKTNSAALAQLLNKEYSKARNTIENIANPDAITGANNMNSMRSPKNKFQGVIYFDQAIEEIGSVIRFTSNDIQALKTLCTRQAGDHPSRVVILENKAVYPSFDWVEVERFDLNK